MVVAELGHGLVAVGVGGAKLGVLTPLVFSRPAMALSKRRNVDFPDRAGPYNNRALVGIVVGSSTTDAASSRSWSWSPMISAAQASKVGQVAAGS
jgi:hypothetical protein